MSSSKVVKKPRLGRGLSSLLATPVSVSPPAAEPETSAAPAAPPAASSLPSAQPAGFPSAPSDPIAPAPQLPGGVGQLVWVEIDAIEPNPYQPRRTFNEEALQSLADSIRRDGVMQPIVLRPRPGQGGGAGGTTGEVKYQLVAGERRWRAARLAGLTRLPAVPHELDDEQLAEWAVVENLHREDLDPIERAEAFEKLIQQFKLTHDHIAERVGVDRVTITNTLRLLDLPGDVRELIRSAQLSAGHGRALLGLPDAESQVAMAKRVVAGGWSVRMVEATVRRLVQPNPTAVKSASRSAHLEDLERQIAAQLQTKVQIKSGRKKGTGSLTLEFFTIEQFDEFLTKLGVRID